MSASRPVSAARVRALIGAVAVLSLTASGAFSPAEAAPTTAATTTPGAFGSVTPTRLLDTRIGTGAPTGPVRPNASLALQILGHGSVPSTGVSAVVLNVTVTAPTAAGSITAYPDGTTKPTASNLNFTANQTIANLVIAPVGTDGKIRLSNNTTGTTHLIADVAGYYLNGSAGSGFGYDVSWPQCNTALPTGAAFGIVGVNGGLSNNTNPCFARQLAWAQGSAGGTSQSRTALYVNTANPGPASASWPTSNVYPAGTGAISNPYGACAPAGNGGGSGANTAACAYMYGYARAYDDVTSHAVPTPTLFRWWLDVETTNSWQSNTAANTADLEGMTSYFTSVGVQVGIYASKYQWGLIAGTVRTASNLSALPNWIPGAGSVAGAQALCLGQPLMTGSITLAQYDAGSIDYDVPCH